VNAEFIQQLKVAVLAHSPIWLSITVALYVIALWVFQRSKQRAWLNPVLLTSGVLMALLLLTGRDYAEYFSSVQIIHILLGPATVALALPLYRERERLRRLARPLLLATTAGAFCGISSALLFGQLFGLTDIVMRSIAAKSVTTPIAMGITEKIGGLPALTAIIVIFTGVLGAMFAKPLLDRLRIKGAAARGLAIGVAAHGVGTARAFQLDKQTGAYAGLAIGLCGAITAVQVPLLFWLARLCGFIQ